ncbi:MAG: hypothetical protein WDN72_09855 [Alphaproteobacteria bacterium]
MTPETEVALYRWSEALAELNVASLCERAAAHGLKPAYATATDFAI